MPDTPTPPPPPPTPDAFAVVAEVVHGPEAAPLLGGDIYCSIDCAEEGVRALTDELADQEGGSSFTVPFQGRPVGFASAATGRIWAVQVLARTDLTSS